MTDIFFTLLGKGNNDQIYGDCDYVTVKQRDVFNCQCPLPSGYQTSQEGETQTEEGSCHGPIGFEELSPFSSSFSENPPHLFGSETIESS